MNKRQLQSLSARQGVPMGTIEKDYALTCILCAMAKFPKLGSMMFKGGTAINKIHYKDARFSEDLDFACTEDVSAEFCDFVENSMAGLSVKFEKITGRVRREDSFRFKMRYVQCNGTRESIRIDMSLRGDVLDRAETKPVLHDYEFPHDLRVPVMSPEEIMAEKVRAAMYTEHPRHLHDLYFLHNKGVKINAEWVETKIRGVYGGSFSMDGFKERASKTESLWTRDLSRFIPGGPPPFDEVFGKVVEVVRGAMGAA